jgi:ABC-2 type transport system ATP-binding protein
MHHVDPQRSQRPGWGEVVLQTSGLTKRFGDLVAVDHLDLSVRSGEVFGFLGPNGSGKSTTVGMLLGLIHPTAGEVALFGKDPREDHDLVRRRVGTIIEAPAFYPYLSGRDNLRALATAAGVCLPAASSNCSTSWGCRRGRTRHTRPTPSA